MFEMKGTLRVEKKYSEKSNRYYKVLAFLPDASDESFVISFSRDEIASFIMQCVNDDVEGGEID